MEKLIRDGNVAVIYSPGFGAGWSTWGEPWMALDKRLAEILDSNRPHAELAAMAEKIALEEYEEDYICTLGAADAKIMWLPQGTAFRINEYDGSESVQTAEDLWQSA